MMANISRFAIFIALLIGMTGCTVEPSKVAQYPQFPAPQSVPPKPDLIETNYTAIDTMVARIRPLLPAESKMIVATVVNINSLENTSTLGRVISEHVLGRLSQSGYGVIELKIRNQVYMKRDEGEFLLTREIRDLARTHNAQALVVGTYAEASDRLFISLKVIDVFGSRIIGAVDYSIDKDSVVRSLLSKNGV